MCRELIVVYTMGKVGSTALGRALGGLDNFRYATYLSKRAILHRVEQIHDPTLRDWGDLWWDVWGEPERLHAALEVVVARQTGTRLKLISGFREPIGHALSEIFQSLEHHFQHWEYEFIIDPEKFFSQIVHLVEKSLRRNCWFQSEFRDFTGFDIFSIPYDEHCGVCLAHFDEIDVLAYRSDHIDRKNFADKLSHFLGSEFKCLPNVNIGEEKHTGILYSLFKSTPLLAHDVIKDAYDSPVFRHFYSITEGEALVKKWSRTDDHPPRRGWLRKSYMARKLGLDRHDLELAETAKFTGIAIGGELTEALEQAEAKWAVISLPTNLITLMLLRLASGDTDGADELARIAVSRNISSLFVLDRVLEDEQMFGLSSPENPIPSFTFTKASLEADGMVAARLAVACVAAGLAPAVSHIIELMEH